MRRVGDLRPIERQLLRRAGRVEPNPTKLDPRDEDVATLLQGAGLVEYVEMLGGTERGVRLTEAGREALR